MQIDLRVVNRLLVSGCVAIVAVSLGCSRDPGKSPAATTANVGVDGRGEPSEVVSVDRDPTDTAQAGSDVCGISLTASGGIEIYPNAAGHLTACSISFVDLSVSVTSTRNAGPASMLQITLKGSKLCGTPSCEAITIRAAATSSSSDAEVWFEKCLLPLDPLRWPGYPNGYRWEVADGGFKASCSGSCLRLSGDATYKGELNPMFEGTSRYPYPRDRFKMEMVDAQINLGTSCAALHRAGRRKATSGTGNVP